MGEFRPETAGTTAAVFAAHAATYATTGNAAIITLAVAFTTGAAATARNADSFHAFHSTDCAARGAAAG